MIIHDKLSNDSSIHPIQDPIYSKDQAVENSKYIYTYVLPRLRICWSKLFRMIVCFIYNLKDIPLTGVLKCLCTMTSPNFPNILCGFQLAQF